MKIIDQYVLKNFLRYLAFSLLTLVFIYIVINLFDNLGKYLAKSVLFKDIVVYYLYLTPSYVALLIPVASIIGVFFVFGFMTKNRELIALKSCGFDIRRLLLILLLTGVLISTLTFVFQETVGIWAAGRMFEHKTEKIDRRPVRFQDHRRNFFYYGEQSWVYYVRDFESQAGRMKGVILWKIDARQKITRRLDAASAEFKDDRWIFFNAVVREFDTLDNEKIDHRDSIVLDDLREKPADFLRRVKPIEEMNFLEIRRYVDRRSRAGENMAREEVEYNYRFSFPVITMIMLLICLPLSLVLRKGGIAIGLGISIVLAFLYWGLMQSCRAYGAAGVMTPVLAAWLPNILFGIFGAISATAIRR